VSTEAGEVHGAGRADCCGRHHAPPGPGRRSRRPAHRPGRAGQVPPRSQGGTLTGRLSKAVLSSTFPDTPLLQAICHKERYRALYWDGLTGSSDSSVVGGRSDVSGSAARVSAIGSSHVTSNGTAEGDGVISCGKWRGSDSAIWHSARPVSGSACGRWSRRVPITSSRDFSSRHEVEGSRSGVPYQPQ